MHLKNSHLFGLGCTLIVMSTLIQFSYSNRVKSVITAAAASFTEDRQPEKLKLRAPEFIGGQWLNTAPFSLAGRRGKVTIVEFWTYACGNCRANLPAYAHWQQRFAKQEVAVVGVHTPETPEEEKPANVQRYLKK